MVSHHTRLMNLVSIVSQHRHYCPRIEDSYEYWILKFIYFRDKRYFGKLAVPEVEAFFNRLALMRPGKVSASTKTQALNAHVPKLGGNDCKRCLGAVWGHAPGLIIHYQRTTPDICAANSGSAVFMVSQTTSRLMSK